MKKSIVTVFIVAIIIGLFYLFPNDKNKNSLKIVGITQIATHPALDEVRKGIIDGLAAEGFVDKKNIIIKFQNANGDPSLTLPICQQFVRDNVAVIVPISTPSTLAVAQCTKDIPIVFSGVTDPIATGLVDSLENPGANITGVSDRWPFEQQIKAFKKYFPNTRKIGMLFKKGDDVSKIGIEALKQLASKLDYELIVRPVSSSSDIYSSAVALFKDVDAIYTGIDHLILENMDGMVRASVEADKPLFGGESGSVEKGAVLALSINMHDFGLLTATLIADVLNGEKPGDIPVETVSDGELIVNKSAAEKFNLNVQEMKDAGAKIY